MSQLRPYAGATEASECPATILTCDGRTLTVTGNSPADTPTTLTPASLYHYRHLREEPSDSVRGLAALDADGLVLLDLPGEWQPADLQEFAHEAGIPLTDARMESSKRVRAVLASRAPSWQRIRGLSPSPPAKWHKPAAICLAIAGAALMTYLISVGLWAAWRGISVVGRILLDILEAKWLLVLFSPALLFLRPLLARTHRRRIKRGTIVSAHGGGPYLSMGPYDKLQITQAGKVTAEIRRGDLHGQAFSLLLYRYEGLTGLLILDIKGRAVHHLPGRWPPEDMNRFAKRHDLPLAIHKVSHEEYLDLTRNAKEATP
ncbi:hypothetical protein AB0I81_58225 [Nonomuraea sp. NPDC050404]|uniref:hypothetical protein n=1 Tax=Nonomuraea sp. NPDC050404 TaxID=3155783 RepID=UPI00340800B4